MYLRIGNGVCQTPTLPLPPLQKTKNDYKGLRCKKLSSSMVRSLTKHVCEKYIGVLSTCSLFALVLNIAAFAHYLS